MKSFVHWLMVVLLFGVLAFAGLYAFRFHGDNAGMLVVAGCVAIYAFTKLIDRKKGKG